MTRVKALAIAIVLINASCNYSKKYNDCSHLKKGVFIYHFRMQNYQTDFIIYRNDSIQTEVDKKTGDSSILSIRWTGDCKYELKLLETTSRFPDSIQQQRKTIPLKTEILSRTKDYYIFKAKRDKIDFVLTDTMWVYD